MSHQQKNLLTLAVSALILAALLLFIPHCATAPAAKTAAVEQPVAACPAVPAKFLSPVSLANSAEWEVVAVEQDARYGLFWFFLQAITRRTDGRTHALAVLAPGDSWPLFYCYLEDTVLVFLRYNPSTHSYVEDQTITVDAYNTIAEYYRVYLNVKVPKRSGV